MEEFPSPVVEIAQKLLPCDFSGYHGFALTRCRRSLTLERGVELTQAVPVLGDLLGVDGLVGAADQRCNRTVVAAGIDPVDALMLDSADARAKAQAQHGESGEVDLSIAMGVGVMLFDLELALVVKQTVQHKGGITVGTLNRDAVEGA